MKLIFHAASLKTISIRPFFVHFSSEIRFIIVWRLGICNVSLLNTTHLKESSLSDHKFFNLTTIHSSISLTKLARCSRNADRIMFTRAPDSLNHFRFQHLRMYQWLFTWALNLPVDVRRLNVVVHLIHFHLRELFVHESFVAYFQAYDHAFPFRGGVFNDAFFNTCGASTSSTRGVFDSGGASNFYTKALLGMIAPFRWGGGEERENGVTENKCNVKNNNPKNDDGECFILRLDAASLSRDQHQSRVPVLKDKPRFL